MDPQEYKENLEAHMKTCREKLAAYNGEIYNSELKEWKRAFERPFEGALDPTGFIRARRDDLIKEEFIRDEPDSPFGTVIYKTGNSKFFKDMLFEYFTIAKGPSILRKLAKAGPENEVEAEAMEMIRACAQGLAEMNGKLKAIKPLSGRRQMEDWQRRPEPEKFTCSCCFRRVAKNPINRKMIADHGFEKAGYRKGICDGAKFPPLEESGAGNRWFLEVSRQHLRSSIRRLAHDISRNPDSLERKLTILEIHATARDINFRKFLDDGMEHAGGYGEFVESNLWLRRNQKRYGAFLYGEVLKDGLDGLKEEISRFLDSGEESLSLHEWIAREHDLPGQLEQSLGQEEPGAGGNALIAWLQENIPFHEFMNMAETIMRVDPSIDILEWLKDNDPDYEEIPIAGDLHAPR